MGANTERNKHSSGLELLEVKKLAKNNQKHQRKGLSSVVGAVFMVLVMIGALNVILLAMRQQDSVTQTLIDKSSASLSRLNEQISIADTRVTSSNKLNMTVINSGAAAAKLASIYIDFGNCNGKIPGVSYRYTHLISGAAIEPNIFNDKTFFYEIYSARSLVCYLRTLECKA